MNQYLVDVLKFENGVEEELTYDSNSQRVDKWLGEGGEREDNPWNEWWGKVGYLPGIGRFYNHFHQPIDDEGLWGLNESFIEWAFMPADSQGSTGNYSWHDARKYYYDALTSLTDTDFQENFAKTFRGLGQLMHLVQDKSGMTHL